MFPERTLAGMQLKEFSLISPVIESGTVLKAIETAIPSDAIEQVIGNAQAGEDRKCALPSHLVVCLLVIVHGVPLSAGSKDGAD